MIAIDVTEEHLMTAMRGFLMSAFQCEIIQGQDNGVPMPTGPFIGMTTMRMRDLSTNKTTYDPANSLIKNSRSSEWAVQLDFYGEPSMEMCNTVAGLARTDYACQQLIATGVDMAPLYAGEPRQTSMINGEQQYEPRWTLEFITQFNPVITTPMQFADFASIKLVEIDTEYPPED